MTDLIRGLRRSLGEVDQILSGEREPVREVIHDGYIVVEIKENGETIWKLSDAIKQLKSTNWIGVETPAEFFRITREILGQTQRAMADICGVSVRTDEEWEIDTRPIGPRSAGKGFLINLMASEPNAVVRVARKPPKVGFMV